MPHNFCNPNPPKFHLPKLAEIHLLGLRCLREIGRNPIVVKLWKTQSLLKMFLEKSIVCH